MAEVSPGGKDQGNFQYNIYWGSGLQGYRTVKEIDTMKKAVDWRGHNGNENANLS